MEMQYFKLLEEREQAKQKKQQERKEAIMKSGEIFGKALLSTLGIIGAATLAAQQEQERKKEVLVEEKNKRVEWEYKSKSIIKGDIDNLRNHVARIVQDPNTPENVREKGKRLLKNESSFWGVDTYACSQYYDFVIDHGL